jgi:zinc protease
MYTLGNGLEVILHRDVTAPITVVNVWYHVGSGDESPGKSGFAPPLRAHDVPGHQAHRRPTCTSNVLSEIGGSGGQRHHQPDRTNYFEIVPSHHLETALWLESDRMGYLLPLLTEKSLEQPAVDVVRNERRQRYDNVPYGASASHRELLYPEGHPYRYLTIGRHEDLEARQAGRRPRVLSDLVRASNATLAIAGDFDSPPRRPPSTSGSATFPALPKPTSSPSVAPPLARPCASRGARPVRQARAPSAPLVWHSPKASAPGDPSSTSSPTCSARQLGRLQDPGRQEELAQGVSRVPVRLVASPESSTSPRHLKPRRTVEVVEAIIRAEVERQTREPISAAEHKRVVSTASPASSGASRT